MAEAVNTESSNVAVTAAELTQNIAADKQSDNLESIRNGILKPGDNTHERWTNWNNRTTSDTASLTFRWDTAQLLSSVNLYYYFDNCCALPQDVKFEYSLDGENYTVIDAQGKSEEKYYLGEMYSYMFKKVINPVALRIVLKQQGEVSGNHCVGLTETEIMTFAGELKYKNSATLSAVLVDGSAIPGFTSNTFYYEADGAEISAESTEENAGITVLPVYGDTVKILTVSEDGTEEFVYTVKISEKASCKHEHTEIQGKLPASCMENGYTGDLVCKDCGKIIEEGKIIQATGHTIVKINTKEPKCEEEGYTGDEVCTVCGATIKAGEKIPAKGHMFNTGVITKEPTETEAGIKTYTCTACGVTKEEKIPVIVLTKKEPKVTVAATAEADGEISLKGKFEDYTNRNKYYEVTAHGIVYISKAKLGTHTLNVNTSGRTKVSFSKYTDTGEFSYSMKPAYASTKYVVRAFLEYKDEKGKTYYVYSDLLTLSYDGL